MTSTDLKLIFEQDYNRVSWLEALRDIFHIQDIHAIPHVVELGENDFDANAVELGYFNTAEGLQIGIYEVSITPEKRLDRNKVGLRNLMRKVYQNDGDAALIVFTQGHTWRFTYASELTVTNKETGMRERRQTDPKRYTYVFGRHQFCRTATERFSSIKVSTDLFNTLIPISEIEKAFSVDILTKDFYKELSDWYFWALTKVNFPVNAATDAKINNSTSLIRLITRLIFVWFLKQKRLIKDELFDKEEIDRLLNYSDSTGSTYYKAILQNLFFATLNTPLKDECRSFVGRQTGNQDYYRYQRFFKDKERFLELTSNIPFLNGGLFDNLDQRIGKGYLSDVFIDCFSNHKDNEPKLTVPDCLFFGGGADIDLSQEYDDTKQNHIKIRGLIDILNSYNFTVEENTPLEMQVALDPELLGKVFENLLASYNPETKSTARKQTGSFYTPREIVSYMVNESLIAYFTQQLRTNINIEGEYNESVLDEKLHDLVSYSGSENPFNELESNYLVKAIDQVKVLDPACGSGAFPMGVLQQLVHILQKIDPRNEKWRELQILRAESEIIDALREHDKETRKLRLQEIEEAFDMNEDDYGRKLFLIENCIYGIDIQPVAVQIAKLRFFISLVCEQDKNPTSDNFGIKPLPNLETKFVAANTLIGINRDSQIEMRTPEMESLEKDLIRIRKNHFLQRDKILKNKLRERDKHIREKIIINIQSEYENNTHMLQATIAKKHKLIDLYQKSIDAEKIELRKRKIKENIEKLKKETSELLAHIANNQLYEQNLMLRALWDPYNTNSSAPFFDMEWMYGMTVGFDLVIGNPPYMQLQKDNGKLALMFKDQYFETFERTGDIYSLFYEKGFHLLKNGGIHTYITSSQWMKASYGKSLRRLFLKNNPLLLIVLGPSVFENAVVDTNILITQKGEYQKQLKGYILTELLELSYPINTTLMPYINDEPWNVINPLKQIINEKIQLKSKPLKDWQIEIYRGVLTGYNEAFIIDQVKRDEIFLKESKSSEIIKPILRGRGIEKYISVWENDYIIFIPWHFPLHNDDNISGASEIAEKQFILQYPTIYNHFIEHRENLLKRNKEETGIRYEWYALQRCAATYKDEFKKEKIIWKRIGSQLRFSYSEDEIFCLDSTCIATGEKIKYLTGLLNSKLSKYQLLENAPKTGMGDLIISVQAIEPLLVYFPEDHEQTAIEKLIDKIIEIKKVNPHSDTSEFENQIDIMLYKIYNFTYDEVKIIDPEFWLSEEEFKAVLIK